MSHRPSATASLAAAVAAVAAATLAAPSAAAADGPAFLDPRELPRQAGTAWQAGPVTSGVPDPLPFCVGEALPGATSRHRAFWTDVDTNAVQVTVVERDEAAARSLAALLDSAVRGCAERVEQDPDVTAEWRDFGRVQAEEGARVQGVRTVHAWAGNDVHLFAVGRDGRTVTVVHWGRMGTFHDAPVNAFKNTTRTAVNKLYRG
ncbi:hypothetical protein HYE82_18870 [Streptomyces sp. BR123]|uniref:hypothetical protein n=1 Tax=Streptomyces sp. BR123 TaxID=2749828 RepID=UPI0015C4BB5F|nr:hypothetical protein [Streptomyces sp. BR123]NXY96416.1 hypothetical protein [Streptomyces sp. BR123]